MITPYAEARTLSQVFYDTRKTCSTHTELGVEQLYSGIEDRGVRIKLPSSSGNGFRELFQISQGIYVTINNFTPHDEWAFGLAGEDALLAHFQISGDSQSTFIHTDRDKEFSLSGPLAVLAYHPADMDEHETFPAGNLETSITISCTRSALEKRFNIHASDFSPYLRHQVYDSPSNFFCEYMELMPYMREDTERLMRLETTGKLRSLCVEGLALNLLSNLLGTAIDSSNHFGRPRISGRDRSAVQQARNILERHFTNPPSVNDLAKSVGLNRNKLSSGFQEVYGQTISECCSYLRMQKACQLLGDTNMKIIDVALQVGYSHPTSFSTAFQRYKGMSPRHYRLYK